MAPRLLIAATLLAGGAAALGGTEEPAFARPVRGASDEATPLTSIPRSAVVYYKEKCLSCHGVTGEGDGEGSKELDPKPRSFRDRDWQQSVTDSKIRDATLKGGPAVGLSEAMPGYPDLEGQDEKLNGLVALIRAFGKVAR
jgi:mono/diheme cytochrome c family protein